MDNYSLRIIAPPHLTAVTHAEEFTRFAGQYRQSTTIQGGFWQASWVFENAERSFAERWYEEHLMYLFQNQIGAAVGWEGFIAEMELSINGFTERRGVLEMANAVRVDYTDESGAEQSTAFVTDDSSIARYGRREEILSLSEVTSDEADAYAAQYLHENSKPWSKPVAISFASDKSVTLNVLCVGRIGTANWRYLTAGDGVTTGNADLFLSEIIADDIQFVSQGNLQSNDLQILQRPKDTPQRAYERVREIVAMGRDAGGGIHESWQFGVYGIGGYATYKPISNEPLYEWLPNGRLTAINAGHISPWLMQCGVLRNRTRTNKAAPPNSFLQQDNDILISEIEMTQGATHPTFKVNNSTTETEQIRAIDDYKRWLEGIEE